MKAGQKAGEPQLDLWQFHRTSQHFLGWAPPCLRLPTNPGPTLLLSLLPEEGLGVLCGPQALAEEGVNESWLGLV